MANLKLLCEKEGISSQVANALLKSVSTSTLNTYRRLWSRFSSWFTKKENPCDLSPRIVCDFLYKKFSEGSSSGSINSYRSAINFFTMNSMDLENNIFLKRLFRYFYKVKPLRPKYTTFWSVPILLKFLESWHSVGTLTLKQFTLKTIDLIALSSSDRGQTLHLASLENMSISEDKVEFIIRQRTKTTRKFSKPPIITCVSCEKQLLNVAFYVKMYIEETRI